MPRPRKWRQVFGLPQTNNFGPLGGTSNNSFVVMSVDEYETIRLIDFEGMKQEECAENMNVARTTVQAIYENARKKLADFLVNGKNLVIEGGNYVLHNGGGNGRHCGGGMGRHIRTFNQTPNNHD